MVVSGSDGLAVADDEDARSAVALEDRLQRGAGAGTVGVPWLGSIGDGSVGVVGGRLPEGLDHLSPRAAVSAAVLC